MGLLILDAAVCVLTAAVVCLFLECRPERTGTGSHQVGVVLFVVAVIAIFSITGVSPLSGFHTDIRWEEISYLPFYGIRLMLRGGWTLLARENILGNVVLFLPIGFFLPMLWSHFRSAWKTLLVGFFTSLLIESSQLFLLRESDVDDLILNTVGTLLGYCCFQLFYRVFPQSASACVLSAESASHRLAPYCCILIPYVVIVLFGFCMLKRI